VRRLLAPGRTRDLVVLGGAAFLLRLAWVLVYGRVNTPDGSVNDTTFYEFTTGSLANGHGYTGIDFQPTAGWPPVLSFLVSLLYRAFGERLSLALALNVVLSAATVVLIYLVAERMLGRREARVAAGLFAILPGPLYMTGLFLSETTFIFELVGFLALLVFLPDRLWKPALLGLALGVAALTRGEGFLMVAIPLAAWWGHVPRRTWLTRSALLIGVMVLTVAPWTIRNAVVLDAFIPVSNNANWTLASAHSPNADGGEVETPPSWTPPGLPEAERAKAVRSKALHWAVDHPLKELGLIPRRLIALNQGSGGSIGGWLNAGPRYQWQLGSSSILVFKVLADAFGYFLLFGTLASLVLVGPRRLWRMHPAMQGVLAYLVLCLVNYGVIYYGAWRYRIPMEPFMVLVATPLLVRVWERRQELSAVLGPPASEGRPARA
jgi:4-amino-4-deoxy-L-arabinose transferase-like glycosyltransferase